MKKLTTFILFLLTLNISAQKIKGIVLDAKTKEPVAKAHIILSHKVVFTNTKGEFLFYHRKGKQKKFSVTHINYNNQEVDYSKENNLKIYLTEKTEFLDEVKLLTERKLQSTLKFKKLDNLPKATHSFASALINDKIYVFGGDLSREVDAYKKALEWHQGEANINMSALIRDAFKFRTYRKFSNKVYSYDLSDKKWTEEEGFKLRKRANHKAVVYKDKVYLIGGKRLSRTKHYEYLDEKVEVLDVTSKKIIVDDTNPHKAVDFGASIYRDNIVITGGSIKDKKEFKPKQFNNQVHLYNISTGLWYEIGKLPVPKETTSTIIDKKVYFFGGYNNKNIQTVSTFDLKTGKWNKLGDLEESLQNPAICNDGNIIYLFENNKLYTFNSKTKELKKYHVALNLISSSLFIYNEKLFILGGYRDSDFEKVATKGLYSINTLELDNTKFKLQVF